MSKLHVFDMDGTLMKGSACLHISDHVGKLPEVDEIEEAWSRGEVGHVEFWERCLPLWGQISDADVDEIFAKSPWQKNVQKVFHDIAARGEYSAVITLSPMFFVNRLLRWGATTAHGAGVFGGETPDPKLVLTPDSKVEIVRRLMQEYGVARSDCIAYGDSSSDVPLFKVLSNTVAINGSEAIKKLSAASYDGDDIWEAYLMGRAIAGIRKEQTSHE
jgi:phosphoserine phosphatase